LIPEITAPELDAWRKDASRAAPHVVDVREPWEFDRAHLDDTTLIPMREIPSRIAELPADSDIVLVCHHGSRSQHVAAFLVRHGYEAVANVAGGIDAWSLQRDTSVPRY